MPIINKTLPSYITNFMDSRHYDPSEIDSLSMGPNTNGEATWYVDGTNGSDSYTGTAPVWDGVSPTSVGPYKTINKALGWSRKYGERVLIRTGYYYVGSGVSGLVTGGFSGTDDDNHWTTLAPYGDGEVVIDTSETPRIGTFEVFTGDIWRAQFGDDFWGHPNCAVEWAVMDWEAKGCRKGILLEGTDSTSTPNKLTSVTDQYKNFCYYSKTSGSGTLDFIGAIVFNKTDGSWGVVTSVSSTINVNDTLNFAGGLTGGINNAFNPGDLYQVCQLDADGKWTNVGDYFYIKSTLGEPRTRNIIVNFDDMENDSIGRTKFQDVKRLYVYGITWVGSPCVQLYSPYGTGGNFKIEKCRFMCYGKGALSFYGTSIGQVTISKCFFYGGVMLNWPYGNNYGGVSGWPQGINQGANLFDGCISWEHCGEGTTASVVCSNNIVCDNYSVSIWQGGSWRSATNPNWVINNVAIHSGYNPAWALDRFYLDGWYNGFQRNYVRTHPQGIIIFCEEGGTYPQYNRVYNNLVIGHWHGITSYFEEPLAGFQNAVIANNTVIMSPDEDLIHKLTSVQRGLSIRAGTYDWNTIWRNNIVIGQNNADGIHYMTSGSAPLGTVTCDYNVYCFPGVAKPFYGASIARTFDEWKALTGHDSHSILTTLPVLERTDWSSLAAITKQDLKLIFDSPAKNIGVDMSAYFTTDYDGNPRPMGGTFDVGAFEYLIPSASSYLVCRVTPFYNVTNRVLVCRITTYVDDKLNHCRVNVLQESSKALQARISVIGQGYITCRVSVFRRSSTVLISRVATKYLDSIDLASRVRVIMDQPLLFCRVDVFGQGALAFEGRVVVRRELLSNLSMRLTITHGVDTKALTCRLDVYGIIAGVGTKPLVSRVISKKLALKVLVGRVTVAIFSALSSLTSRVKTLRKSSKSIQCRVSAFYHSTNRVLVCSLIVYKLQRVYTELRSRVTVVYISGSINCVSRVNVRVKTSRALACQVEIYVTGKGKTSLRCRAIIHVHSSMALVCRVLSGYKEGYQIYSQVWPSISLRSLCQRSGM